MNFYKILEKTVLLSSLTHDLGKNNIFFQKKIRRKRKKKERDPVRHEILSFFFLQKIMELKDLDSINSVLKTYNKDKFLKEIISNIDSILKEKKIEYTIFDVILYTVLTHHKNIIQTGNFIKNCRDDIEKNFINNYSNEKDWQNFFSLENVKPFPKSLKKEIKKYLDDKELLYQIDKKIFYNLYLLTRTILMLADHYASQKKEQIPDNNKNILLANKIQSLEFHLKNVTEEALNFLKNIKKEKELKKIELPDLKKSNNEKFKWQDIGANFVKKIAKENKNNVYFIINNADTGSGKTIGNIKILKAIKEKIRFNFVLPLRSLSTQIFDVFRDELKIDDRDVGIVIGNIHDDENEEIITAETDPNIQNIIKYQYNRNSNYRVLYEKPVIVGTIDYLMKATDSNRSKYLLPFMRIFTSDTVIFDEIDYFSPDDLSALTRLFFLLGVLGKYVILSSATLTFPIVDVFFNAYKKGFEIYSHNKNDVNLIFAGINNKKEPVKFDNENYKKQLTDFLKKENKEQKVLYEVWENLEIDEKFFNKVYEFHDNFYQSYKDKKISMGFIKTYSTNHLFRLFKDFIENMDQYKKDDYKIITLFYHSREFEEIKREKEKLLYSILQKKNEKYKQNFYNFIKDIKEKNIIFLLFSTPVLEIGKDWDFDFGFCEYTSVSDVIQTAGRIRRHRSGLIKKNNFVIFYPSSEYTLKYIDNKEILSQLKRGSNINDMYNNSIYFLEQKFIEKFLYQSLVKTNFFNCILTYKHQKNYIFRKNDNKSAIIAYNKGFFFNNEKSKRKNFFVSYLDIDKNSKIFIKDFPILSSQTYKAIINYKNNGENIAYYKNIGFVFLNKKQFQNATLFL